MSSTPSAIAGAGSVPGEPVVADPEIVESPTTIEEPSESTAEPSEPSAEPEVQPGETPSSEPEGDTRRLPQHIRDLKEANPEAFKRAKAEFYDLSARRSVHPTVQAAREEHELLASAGGAEGIARLREDGQFFKQAATQFAKGDRGFYSTLWEEDPVAAALGLSHMLELAREKDPATYKPTLARLWDTEFSAVGFAPALKNLRAAVAAKDFDAAAAIVDSITGWQDSISSVARQAEDPRVKALLAERATRVENEEKTEREAFLSSYKTEAINTVVEASGKTFDSFFKGRKISDEDRTDLLRESIAYADRIVRADKEFIEQREAHLKAGDRASALRLTQARYAKVMPEAVKRVARRYGMLAGPAKPAAPTNGNQPARPGTGAPAQGFVQVTAIPSADEIDFGKSPKDMRMSGRAVLKNGRKVSWAHLRAKAS